MIGFTNEAYNRASGTRNAFGALSDDLVREGYPRMVSRSGDRELEDQIRLFTTRYRQQAAGSGAFGDVRTWDGRNYGYPGGTRWVRVSSEGTVAAPTDPPTSNHGRRRSNDLLYPYNSNTAAHRRAKELAKRHNITCEGENFGEKWHWTYWGPLGTIAAPAGEGEEDMPLSKEDIAAVAAAVTKSVWNHPIQPQDANGRYVEGSFPARGFLSSAAAQAQAAKDAAQAAPAEVWNRPLQAQDKDGHYRKNDDGSPLLYPARGFLASTNAQVGAIQAPDVDEAALAAALAPLITAQLGALSDEDVARLATAVADEQARRLAN